MAGAFNLKINIADFIGKTHIMVEACRQICCRASQHLGGFPEPNVHFWPVASP